MQNTNEEPEIQLVFPEEARPMLKLGVITPTTSQWDAYLMWGKLIDNWEFRTKWWHKCTLAEAVAKMPKAERVKLRDRMLGVIPFQPNNEAAVVLAESNKSD
jgi:hypothetical protein